MMPTFADLAAWLRTGADGVYAERAAVDLLITHQTWLLRDDFTTNAIYIATETDVAPMAFIDWPKAAALLEAGALPCSLSEAAVLGVAASLTGQTTVALCVVSSLDAANLKAVLVAIAHAAGHSGVEVRL